jgi:hypothetical protein
MGKNEQFEYINSQAIRFIRQGQPVISVESQSFVENGDTKISK